MAGYTADQLRAAYAAGTDPGSITSMLANGGEWTAARVQQEFGFTADRMDAFRNEGILFADDYVSGIYAPGVASVSTADVQGWLAANPGATDRQIAAAMDKHGVSVDVMAQATNRARSEVQRRYNEAVGPEAVIGTNVPTPSITVTAPAPAPMVPVVRPPVAAPDLQKLLMLAAAVAAAIFLG